MDNEQSVEDVDMITEESHEEIADSIDLDEEDILETDDDDSDEIVNSAEEGLSWYIVQCYSLYEQKVRDRILQMQEDELKDLVFRVLLPEELLK